MMHKPNKSWSWTLGLSSDFFSQTLSQYDETNPDKACHSVATDSLISTSELHWGNRDFPLVFCIQHSLFTTTADVLTLASHKENISNMRHHYDLICNEP